MGRARIWTLGLVLVAVTLAGRPARALIEAKGNAGLVFIDPGHMNQILSESGIKQVFLLGLYGFDAKFTSGSFGVGVRYDWRGIKVNAAGGGNSAEAELSSARTAIVAHYRLLDTIAYLGPVVTVGVNHKPKLSLKTGGTTVEYNDGKGESVTGGVELGLKLGPILLGAEGGFESYLIRELKGPSGPAGFDMNLGGFYMLGTLGVSI